MEIVTLSKEKRNCSQVKCGCCEDVLLSSEENILASVIPLIINIYDHLLYLTKKENGVDSE